MAVVVPKLNDTYTTHLKLKKADCLVKDCISLIM